MTKREVRTLGVSKLEVRAGAEDAGESRRIVGHAAVFDRESEPIGGMFVEKVASGAFSRALEEGHDVRALVNHDPNLVLGRSVSGTLALEQDDEGLLVSITPPDTQAARDLMVSIDRGDVDQMSFAFTVKKQSWEEAGASNGMDLRVLEDVDLFDVSVVTYPAYPDTDVGLRAHAEWRSESGADVPADVQVTVTYTAPEEPEDATPEGTPRLSIRRRRQRLAE